MAYAVFLTGAAAERFLRLAEEAEFPVAMTLD